MAKAKQLKSAIIYAGPSLIDGSPILCVAVFSNRNRKTGKVLHTYILRADMDPLRANKTGADYAICGNCPHRGAPSADPSRKTAENRSCYVVLFQGPLGVYKGVQRGIYPTISGHDAIAALGAGRIVRVGTYGDPAAVPSYIWDSLLSQCDGHMAYSHQSAIASADFRADIMMQSAETETEARAAWANGARTFRVVKSVSDIVKGAEILCPASAEAGYRTNCNACKLCGGSSIKAKSIAIPAHGIGAGNFQRAA